MNLTKAQADKIKDSVSGRFGCVYLRCDNYLIIGEVSQQKFKLKISVYVNGSIKGADIWHGKEGDFSQMPDLTRRFYCPVKHRVNVKQQAMMLKIWGKKEFNKKRMGEAYYTCLPWFNSPGGFVSHLQKYNESIEILDYQTYTDAMEELEKGGSDAA